MGAIVVSALVGGFAAFRTVMIVVNSQAPNEIIVGWHAVTAALFAYVAIGAWRGWGPSFALGILAGAALSFAGLYFASRPGLAYHLLGLGDIGLVGTTAGVALVLLLVVPQASRDWYRYER
jgi:hypothetical protein